MPTRSSLDEKIDAFVSRFNGMLHERRFADEVPESVRTDGPDSQRLVAWTIRPATASWVEELEARLPRRLPPSFRSLVARYAFPAFELGPFRLFANTGVPSLEDELAIKLFADPVLSRVLLRNGFIQIGVSTRAWYDPVCFDTQGPRRGAEYPLVRIDHETALQSERIQISERLADSFLEMLSS